MAKQSKRPKKQKALQRRRHRQMLMLLALVIAVTCVVGGLAVYGTNNRDKATAAHKVQQLSYDAHWYDGSNTTPISMIAKPPSLPDYTIPPVVDGLAPVLSHIPTQRSVVFLGIDDGENKQAFELTMMKENNVKASLFLADVFIKDNPQFFRGFIEAGSLIEDHSMSHNTAMSKLSYDEQVKEICGQDDKAQALYGRRPVLFRPPGGDYNRDTQRAAADCGMKAVVQWIAKANGGSMQYQIGDTLRPGDIVLMHFRPEFKDDMQAFLNAQNAAGLHTELLEDWLSP
jgi:peptidoglycan/xylan/chitin deacetylase (PgdA/CDA1 family)